MYKYFWALLYKIHSTDTSSQIHKILLSYAGSHSSHIVQLVRKRRCCQQITKQATNFIQILP